MQLRSRSVPFLAVGLGLVALAEYLCFSNLPLEPQLIFDLVPSAYAESVSYVVAPAPVRRLLSTLQPLAVFPLGTLHRTVFTAPASSPLATLRGPLRRLTWPSFPDPRPLRFRVLCVSAANFLLQLLVIAGGAWLVWRLRKRAT